MTVIRLDIRVAYITTGVFVVAMLIVGADLLHRSGITLTEGDRCLLDLDEILRDRFGAIVSTLFLVGFWATSFSSLLGVWQGVSLLFTDFVRTRRERHGQLSEGPAERSWPYRGYLLWLTFPPMVLVFLGQPFVIVVVYGAIGAFFMPFLALTLVWLLNSSRTPERWRNGWLSNVLLVAAAALFVVLCVDQLIGLVG